LYGVLERKLTLDAVIAEKANRKTRDIDCGALCLLRIGAYQLFFLERIPVSAACNEGVKLAGKYCPKAKGFVNAVMRSLAALSPDGLFDLIKNGAKSDTEYLSLRYSISESISKLLCEQYGYSGAEKMLSSLYPESQITSIRVNTLKSTANELLKAFEGADAMLSEITDKCINIRGNFVPEAYEEFEKGCFFIQSEPSCICASALGARKGDRVIDACACP
jgi:16S rRNA (cytosine967-C5)-methyltransferase